MAEQATLTALAKDLTQGRTTASALVEQSLAAIADPARQGAVAFTEVFAAEARKAALDVDARRAAGQAMPAFAGVPVAIKDLFDVTGHPTAAGSSVPGPPAEHDAWAVAALRRAGLIPIGHTNMTEFAFSGLGLNPHHGTPLSPWGRAEGRVAGGSTSGGAVAVAEGMAPLALGSDTGGSCRIPAAFCNQVGFKPTQARVSRDGAVPLSTTLDTVGWITADVESCIAADAVLTGEAQPLEPVPLKGLRFAVPEQLAMNDLEPIVRQAFDGAVARLRAAGATVKTASIPALDEIPVMNRLGGFSGYEAYQWHRERIAKLGPTYDPRVLTRIERGGQQTDADYAELKKARASLIQNFNAAAQSFDVLIFPTTPGLPPRLSELERDEDYLRINLLVLRNSTMINMVDGCAISLPIDRAGPPIGLTLAGPGGRDRRILGAARAVEIALRA
jgi:aspartyl-tRNA(Asn)/glutamyl-tRNA(Gln) amidotransferase subunit A